VVKKACSEENYAVRCQYGTVSTDSAPEAPKDWQHWEEEGWEGYETDWPILDLFLELAEDSDFVRILGRAKSPLHEPRKMVHYVLLHHLWRHGRPSLQVLYAVGRFIELARTTPGWDELYDRGLLVFRNLWNRLPMLELTQVAAEVYAGICQAVPGFNQPLDGMDLDHLEACWTGSGTALRAIEQQVSLDIRIRS
jgi:hypothetical protein